jgi:LuxR family maltose regulon positive regulatory protein
LACDSLQQAIQSCLLEPFVRSFIDEGASMVELLQELRKRLHTSSSVGDKAAMIEYVQQLLVHTGDQSASQAAEPLQQALVEPLTKRELEMLQMITDGHSNKDIGSKLFVAESTVKWHLGNIYSKIGVKNRTQAIASGRQLGLID